MFLFITDSCVLTMAGVYPHIIREDEQFRANAVK